MQRLDRWLRTKRRGGVIPTFWKTIKNQLQLNYGLLHTEIPGTNQMAHRCNVSAAMATFIKRNSVDSTT
ncbi:hypothetical protein CHS0354_019212, partial [Potamilus streckersoni]